jgi:hypothetical protein
MVSSSGRNGGCVSGCLSLVEAADAVAAKGFDSSAGVRRTLACSDILLGALGLGLWLFGVLFWTCRVFSEAWWARFADRAPRTLRAIMKMANSQDLADAQAGGRTAEMIVQLARTRRSFSNFAVIPLAFAFILTLGLGIVCYLGSGV